MRSIYLLFLFPFALFSCTATKTIPYTASDKLPEGLTTEQGQLIGQTIAQLPNNTQFAVAIIDHGKVTHHGLQRTDNQIKAINNKQSVFEIGSISKVMTCHLMMDMLLGWERSKAWRILYSNICLML